MPVQIRKTFARWGDSGKKYLFSEYGREKSIELAKRQGRAIHASKGGNYKDSILSPEYSLNDKEMRYYTGLPVSIYPNIKTIPIEVDYGIEYQPTDQVILYETQPNIGHWCLIMNHGDRIEFFDSYGFKPDEVLISNGPEITKELGQFPALLYMLLEYVSEYNDTQYQPQDNLSATCGKWVAIRYLFKDFTCHQFEELFKFKDIELGDEFINELFNDIFV